MSGFQKHLFPVLVEAEAESSLFTNCFKRSERTQLMLLITWKEMVASQIDKLEEAKNTPVKCGLSHSSNYWEDDCVQNWEILTPSKQDLVFCNFKEQKGLFGGTSANCPRGRQVSLVYSRQLIWFDWSLKMAQLRSSRCCATPAIHRSRISQRGGCARNVKTSISVTSAVSSGISVVFNKRSKVMLGSYS